MDGKGRAFDNIFVERFWRKLKYEDVYLKGYETVVECRKGLGEYIVDTTTSTKILLLTGTHHRMYILEESSSKELHRKNIN